MVTYAAPDNQHIAKAECGTCGEIYETVMPGPGPQEFKVSGTCRPCKIRMGRINHIMLPCVRCGTEERLEVDGDGGMEALVIGPEFLCSGCRGMGN